MATTIAASLTSTWSTRIRKSPSTGAFRSSIRSIRAALSTEEWACSEQTTTFLPVTCFATMHVASVDVDAVSSMCPCHPSGRPSSCASQSIVSSSSSVRAGEVRQRKPTLFSVATSSSARIPGSDAVVAK